MPFERPSLSTLVAQGRASVETELEGSDSRLRRSFLDVLVRLVAGLAHGAYGYLDWIARQSIPDTSTGPELRRWCSLFGVAEVPAAFAVGSVSLSGTNGTLIPAGTALRRADSTEYATSDDATIASGAATVDVVAVASGTAGNAEAGVSLQFVSPILGVNITGTVVAPGITGGTDSESEESLLQRLVERLQKPPSGGAAFDYERQAKLYPGVTDVFVYGGLRDDVQKGSVIGTTVDSEVNGNWLPRGAVTRVKVVVYWRSTNLSNNEVVGLLLNLQDATSSGGAGAADFGAGVSPTLFTAPASGGPHTAEGVLEQTFSVSAARAYLRTQQTLTTSSTGTATWSVTVELEGDIGVVHVAPLFYDRADPIPISADIDAVEELLSDPAFKPVTAILDVYALTPVPVNFTIVTPDDEVVQAAITAELKDLFRREATPGGVLLISHIREAISIAAGETDHSLTTPTANIDLAGDVTKIATVGTITWVPA